MLNKLIPQAHKGILVIFEWTIFLYYWYGMYQEFKRTIVSVNYTQNEVYIIVAAKLHYADLKIVSHDPSCLISKNQFIQKKLILCLCKLQWYNLTRFNVVSLSISNLLFYNVTRKRKRKNQKNSYTQVCAISLVL